MLLSINKLLASTLPLWPFHTNILKDNAPQLFMDGSVTIFSNNRKKNFVKRVSFVNPTCEVQIANIPS